MISFQFLVHTIDDMEPILEMLVCLENLPLELLRSFCTSFQLNVGAAYLARAQYLITSTDDKNLKERIPLIHEVLNHIKPIEVQTLVANIRCKISPYNYELHACLLNIILESQPDNRQVRTLLESLNFLSSYDRCVPPGIMDQQASFYRLPGSPEWPLKRLPWYYILDSGTGRAIYYEDFHIVNWKIWYNAPAILPLNPDEVCLLAVNNSVKRYVKDKFDQVSFILRRNFTVLYPNIVYFQSQIEDFFIKIKECLESVSNIYLAAACADQFVQRLVTSPEQYYAAELHMLLCDKWKDEDHTGMGAFYLKHLYLS